MAIADLQSISSSRGLLATETFSKVGSLFDYGIKRYKVLSWEARQPRLRLGVWRLTRWRVPTPLTKPFYIPKTYRNTKNLSIFFCTPFIWDSFSGTNRTFNVFSHTAYHFQGEGDSDFHSKILIWFENIWPSETSGLWPFIRFQNTSWNIREIFWLSWRRWKISVSVSSLTSFFLFNHVFDVYLARKLTKVRKCKRK